MEAVIIVAIIAGAAILTGSFFIKDKPELDKEEKEKLADEIRSMTMSDDSMDMIMKEASARFSNRIDGIADEKINETFDKMGQSANEKMLAINEMADQIVEKIDENHKEVVFLYDMLNEKSDNIKDYSSRLEGMKREIDSETKMLQTLSQSIDEKAAVVRANQRMNEAIMMNNIPDPVLIEEQESESEDEGTDTRSGPLTGIQAAAAATKKRAAKKFVKAVKPEIIETEDTKKETVTEAPAVKNDGAVEQGIINQKILDMHKDGMSVMEISKELGIGQGEVSLVIGLYGNRK